MGISEHRSGSGGQGAGSKRAETHEHILNLLVTANSRADEARGQSDMASSECQRAQQEAAQARRLLDKAQCELGVAKRGLEQARRECALLQGQSQVGGACQLPLTLSNPNTDLSFCNRCREACMLDFL